MTKEEPQTVSASPLSDGLDAISAMRVDIYDCIDKPPRDYIRAVVPKNAVRSAWIPQTMGDQIWVLYEFKSKAERVAWEDALPADVSRWLTRSLLPHAMGYGWSTRDENGWPCLLYTSDAADE